MAKRAKPENPPAKPFRRSSAPRVAPPPVEREPGKPPGVAHVPAKEKPPQS